MNDKTTTHDALAARQYCIAFLVLAAPSFLNDLAYIATNGTYGVYLVDYGSRFLVLGLCFLWPVSRAIAMERLEPGLGTELALLCAAAIPVLGRLSHYLLERPFVELTGFGGLFSFPAIGDPALYWLDLSVGLFAVALSEELIFRKFALRWLEAAGRTPLQIIVISAVVFALIHWGSGPGRLLYAFVAGIFYMTAYYHLRRLWPTVLAHWIENFLSFGPLNL
jgi:membrane protease YdiL (CAAX protease family)